MPLQREHIQFALIVLRFVAFPVFTTFGCSKASCFVVVWCCIVLIDLTFFIRYRYRDGNHIIFIRKNHVRLLSYGLWR